MDDPKNIRPLSTIAQSVSNAAETAQYEYWETSDKCTKDENWALEYEMIAAAVLRAVASNAKFKDSGGLTAYGGFCLLRDQLEEIVTELEGPP
jgi:hypothetical protein